jgi:hypothetical protein
VAPSQVKRLDASDNIGYTAAQLGVDKLLASVLGPQLGFALEIEQVARRQQGSQPD